MRRRGNILVCALGLVGLFHASQRVRAQQITFSFQDLDKLFVAAVEVVREITADDKLAVHRLAMYFDDLGADKRRLADNLQRNLDAASPVVSMQVISGLFFQIGDTLISIADYFDQIDPAWAIRNLQLRRSIRYLAQKKMEIMQDRNTLRIALSNGQTDELVDPGLKSEQLIQLLRKTAEQDKQLAELITAKLNEQLPQ